ncbi:MAG: hypothetical protein NZ659_05105, partial [Acidimicrobiales bacterium]|nr:hypothetical protein [Acidimicrobiales bacterium]
PHCKFGCHQQRSINELESVGIDSVSRQEIPIKFVPTAGIGTTRPVLKAFTDRGKAVAPRLPAK